MIPSKVLASFYPVQPSRKNSGILVQDISFNKKCNVLYLFFPNMWMMHKGSSNMAPLCSSLIQKNGGIWFQNKKKVKSRYINFVLTKETFQITYQIMKITAWTVLECFGIGGRFQIFNLVLKHVKETTNNTHCDVTYIEKVNSHINLSGCVFVSTNAAQLGPVGKSRKYGVNNFHPFPTNFSGRLGQWQRLICE
jgi:hypothetical protein